MGIGKLYSLIFLYTVIVLTIIVANGLSNKSYQGIKTGNGNWQFALILCVIFGLWLGMRPPTYDFADTGSYAHYFSMLKQHLEVSSMRDNEWIWNQFMDFCAENFDVSVYFTIVSLCYFGFLFIACYVLTKNNVLAALLFLLGAFSCYTYAVNGIRNGVACSIVLWAIALFANSRKNLPLVVLISFIALNIHRSTMLPIASLFASVYFVKSFKQAYTFWILAIVISLVAGGTVTSFFSGLGFDERESYLTDTANEDSFSHTGFRWDFLIYSMMPIVLGYYIVIKRGIQDRAYLILLNTYTIANAFWVMLIRASFSNRFAYLSWFMYPMVLAYPLLKLDIWGEEQGKYLQRIMLAQIGFTWFMETIYW